MKPETHPPTATFGPARRQFRVGIALASVVAVAAIAALAPPIAQPEAYHAFADQRTLWGVPNFFDVTSNLAFLAVGLAGLHFTIWGVRARSGAAFQDSSERLAWGSLFAATALTCFGSAYYHLAPDSARLAWDRLPMAIGFMALVAAVVSERISATAGRRMLAPLCVLGAASVWYWRWSAAMGFENLNPYIAVQFGSALIVLLVLALFPARFDRGGNYLVAVGLYALAKVAELLDDKIFAATGGVVSGHTIKHLLAAAAIFWLLRMLRLRTPAVAGTWAAADSSRVA